MKTKTALISPLNWGLGHASRCIPVINDLVQDGFEVIIVGNGESLRFLQSNFSDLKSEKISGLDINYSNIDSAQTLKLGFQIPKIIKSIQSEKKDLKALIEKHQPELIVSDNRYGFYNSNVKSVIITHQINPIFPVLNKQFKRQIHLWLNCFDEVWIPDNETINLSGALSVVPESLKLKTNFIGIKSHLEPSEFSNEIERQNDVLLILSGPEPQRSKLKTLVSKAVSGLKIIIVGESGSSQTVNSKKLIELINDSKFIITRSGYSSIMDLFEIKDRVIFIATPGLTEQEYLAERLKTKLGYKVIAQSNINEKSLNKMLRF